MGKYLIAAVLTVLLHEIQGFSFSWPKLGRCPDLAVQQDFDVISYMGRWYAQAGYNIEMIQGKGKCGNAIYSFNYNRQVVIVTNQQITPANKWESINGTAVEVDPSKMEGKLAVTFHVPFWGKVTGPYWVLGTDYQTYSVVFGCRNLLFFFHYYSTWVLSREQDIDGKGDASEFYASVDAILTRNNMDPSNFQKVDQVNCDV